MQQIKTKFTQTFAWIKAKKIRMALVGLLALALIGGIGYTLVYKKDRQAISPPPPQNQTEKQSATIRIESEPAGIAIDGIPECTGDKTPYECTPKTDRIVLLAPSQVDIQNKTYYFQSWVGCKNGDDQPGACVLEKSTDHQLIRVLYAEKKTQATTQRSAAVTPPAKKTPKSSPGPCGGADARIENGKVVCEMKLEQSIMPVEVRLLAPNGTPGIEVSCSDSAACSSGYPAVTFSAKSFDEGFLVSVTQPTTITISIPVTRQKEKAVNGQLGIATFTSSYWVYGPSHGNRCCGTNPPLIYDVYNGYTESFKPY